MIVMIKLKANAKTVSTLIVCCILICLMSCKKKYKPTEKIYECALEMADKNSRSREGKKFVSQLNDSLKLWMDKIYVLKPYKDANAKLSRKVLFNSSKTSAIGFLVRQRIGDGKRDWVKTISGEYIDGRWRFYYAGNWELLFDNCLTCDKESDPIPFEDLEDRAIMTVVSSMYFTDKTSCKINDSRFTNLWVSRERREIHKTHFLTKTYDKMDSSDLDMDY